MDRPRTKIHDLPNGQRTLAVAFVRLRIDTVQVASGPSYPTAPAVHVVAMTVIDQPALSGITLIAKQIFRLGVSPLGIVHRHCIAARVEPTAQVHSGVADRSGSSAVYVSA